MEAPIIVSGLLSMAGNDLCGGSEAQSGDAISTNAMHTCGKRDLICCVIKIIEKLLT